MKRQQTLELVTGDQRRRFVQNVLGRLEHPPRTIEMGGPATCPACGRQVPTFCTRTDRALVLATHRKRNHLGPGLRSSEVCSLSLSSVRDALRERLRRIEALLTDTSCNPDLMEAP